MDALLQNVVSGLLVGSLYGLPAASLRSYTLASRYYLSFGVILLTVAISAYLTRSKLGLGMLTVREDEDAARAIGVNVFRHKITAFTLSAGLAGLAGGSFAFFHVSYYPSLAFSPEWTFDALIVVFIGGVGTLAGPLIGAVFFVLVRDVLAANANLANIHLLISGCYLCWWCCSCLEGLWKPGSGYRHGNNGRLTRRGAVSFYKEASMSFIRSPRLMIIVV
jgi:ABC-type branched-subunit amino acid transport system permease subunit